MVVFAGDPILASDVNDLTINWHAGEFVTASVGPTSSTTELVVITVPSTVYVANRAYLIKVTGGVVVSTGTNSPLFRLRKTDTSGQQFDVFRVLTTTASHGANYDCYFIVGGSDVTAQIVLTLTGTAGFTATLSAAATSPASVNIYDVGAAGNYSGAATLV